MRKHLIAFLFLTFCPFLIAQQTAQQTMNSDAVVKLQSAGVSDSVIIGMINASPCSFDTSTDGVIALKNAGVHDTVVLAIINRMNALAHPRAPYIAAPPPRPTILTTRWLRTMPASTSWPALPTANQKWCLSIA